MRGGFGIEGAALTLALAGLGGCATMAGGPLPANGGALAANDSSAPGHWQRLQDSLTAEQIADQRGPRVSVRASYTTFGGTRQVRSTFTLRDDGYVLVAHVDADGRLSVLFPKRPEDDGYVEGGRSYSIPEFDAGFQNSYAFARSSGNLRYRPFSSRYDSYDGGTGYIFVVASWRPMHFDRIVENGRWASYRMTDAYSLADPHDAVDEFAALIAGDSREAYSVEYAKYFRSNYTASYDSYAFNSLDCSTGYSSLFGSSYSGIYSPYLVALGSGWFYLPTTDPFSGCTSYRLAYLGGRLRGPLVLPRDTTAAGTRRNPMLPPSPRDSNASAAEKARVANGTLRMSTRGLAPADAYTPQPDYRARGLITVQGGATTPRSPDVSGGLRAAPTPRLGDPRPDITEMVLRSRDRGDDPVRAPSARDVNGGGRRSAPTDLPVVRAPAAVERAPRAEPGAADAGRTPPRAAPRTAPTHAEPRAETPRTSPPPTHAAPAAAPAASVPRESHSHPKQPSH